MLPNMRVLANDGIAADGKALLEQAGFEVITETIPQQELASRIGEYDVLVVRSATKVTADILQASKNLKLVVRAGVGIDNIDTKAAEAAGVAVSNTPNSSTLSVAELVIAHAFSLARYLFESNREMPTNGKSQFKDLKKKYEKGFELRGKTLGVVGFGRIGQEVAKIAIGLGMKVIASDLFVKQAELVFDHLPFSPVPKVSLDMVPMETILAESDIITVHVPRQSGTPSLLSTAEFAKMKKGIVLINTARGGVIDETALAAAIQAGQVGFAALDVFENEPNVDENILKAQNISFTPHIGASTREGQARVGKEVAEVIISRLKG